jgi:hypothetical protein
MDDQPEQLPDELPFEEWVAYVFDHPAEEENWWWSRPGLEAPVWWNDAANRARTLSHLTRLFSKPGILLPRFSRVQIDRGFNFLVSNACSNHIFALRDTELPWADRRACFDAMIPLYRDLFAPVYQNDLGHTQRGPGDPQRPNFSCYMWWDVIPLYGGIDHPDRDRMNDAVLNVFGDVLKLQSEACLESVLHGLGHWSLYIRDRTEPLVRGFLERTDISPALRSYAERAAVGVVL